MMSAESCASFYLPVLAREEINIEQLTPLELLDLAEEIYQIQFYQVRSGELQTGSGSKIKMLDCIRNKICEIQDRRDVLLEQTQEAFALTPVFAISGAAD